MLPDAFHSRDVAVRRLALRAHAWRHYSVNRSWNFGYTAVSGAVLHGLALWTPERRIHVVQEFSSSWGDHAADVVKTERSLANPTIVDGLPTLPIADTVVDCLRVLDFEPAMIVCESALWRGVPRDVLEAAIERAARRRGVGRARAVLSAASALSESTAETRARLLLLALAPSAGQPVQQFWVTLGGRRFRLDYAWPDLLVALEIDGRSKYLGRTPTSDVLLAERERENALTNAGWIVVRITWSDLNHPERVEAMLVRAFERARRMRAA